MEYEWGKDTARHPWWRLRPVGSPAWHTLSSIASVHSQKGGTHDKPKREYLASYTWQSTGNEPYKWAVFGSVPAARKWVEAELAKFWEPPQVKQ